MDNASICFDDWEHALRVSVPADRRHAYREAIVKFKYWFQETGKLPDAETFREHLEWKKSYLAPDRCKNTARGVAMVLPRGQFADESGRASEIAASADNKDYLCTDHSSRTNPTTPARAENGSGGALFAAGSQDIRQT